MLFTFHFEPAHGWLVVDRSTTRGIAPAGSDVLAVFDDAGNSRISVRVSEHLLTTRSIVLGVVFLELDTL